MTDTINALFISAFQTITQILQAGGEEKNQAQKEVNLVYNSFGFTQKAWLAAKGLKFCHKLGFSFLDAPKLETDPAVRAALLEKALAAPPTLKMDFLVFANDIMAMIKKTCPEGYPAIEARFNTWPDSISKDDVVKFFADNKCLTLAEVAKNAAARPPVPPAPPSAPAP